MSKLVKLVKQRNKVHKNVNITSVGLPGSGKSYGNIVFLQEITGIKDESVLDFVYFDGHKYVEYLKEPSSKYETSLLDDAGFTFSGREWWKEKNIDFVKEIQVARMGRKNLLLSTPHPRLVDSGLGPITHILIVLDYWASLMVGKGHSRKHVIEANDKGVQEYWKYYSKLEFGHLDDGIAEAYEERKLKELRKKKKEQPKEDNELFEALSYLGGLSWKDLEIMIAEKNGQYKPFSMRRIATIIGKKKSYVSEFMCKNKENVRVR